MATLEDRFNSLAQDYAAAIQQVVRKLDQILALLTPGNPAP